VSGEVVAAVVPLGEGSVEVAHEGWEDRCGGAEEEVDVVGHEDVGEHVHAVALGHAAEQLEVFLEGVGGTEQPLAAVAAASDVVDALG